MTHNGFTQHKIKHLSPSAINHFLGCPGSFVVERILKKKGTPGAAMHRGIVVEDAVAAVIIHGQSVEDATADALADFDKRCAMLLKDTSKERDGIPGMIEQTLIALDGFGEIIPPLEGMKQHKVELICNLDDGTKIPVIGYLDFAFKRGNAGTIVDLKTTHRCPSRQTFAHMVQRCVYDAAASDGWDVQFLYATPKKTNMLADGDPAEVLGMVKAVANRINNFLKLSPDPAELCKFVPVVPDSFYWSDPAMKDVRKEIFGL